MKRINSKTGLEFKEGDLREDGYIFVSYRSLKNGNGYFREDWAHPEIFKRKKIKKNSSQKKQTELAAKLKAEGKLKRRFNPITKKPFKRGDVIGNKYFWEYRPRAIRKNKTVPEIWLSKKEFARQSNYFREMTEFRSRQGLNFAKEGKLIKRLNPLTGKYFVSGDRRESDGWFFSNYSSRLQADGYMQENWSSPDAWLRKRIGHTFRLALERAIRKKVPFNIDREYLLQLFPKNNKCPILNIEFKWGREGGKQTSPSLDRIEPKKGYVKGNIVWISDRANTLKSDGNLDDLKKVLKWMEKK